MFSKIAILATVALSAAAATIPTGVPPVPTGQPQAAAGLNALQQRSSRYTCNTGALQCCNQAQQAGSQNGLAIIHSLLGAGVQGITGLVGTQCSPVTVIGTGSGGDCVAEPMCCEDNQIHGLVAIGCSPAVVKL